MMHHRYLEIWTLSRRVASSTSSDVNFPICFRRRLHQSTVCHSSFCLSLAEESERILSLGNLPNSVTASSASSSTYLSSMPQPENDNVPSIKADRQLFIKDFNTDKAEMIYLHNSKKLVQTASRTQFS